MVEQSIFLSLIRASIKKSKTNWKRYCNKTKTKKTIICLPEIYEVFLSTNRRILQNLNRRSVLNNLFFLNNPLIKPKKMTSTKKLYICNKIITNAKY